ncbi:hypothetical protein N0V82_005629 [Gnomoniopsis sp. IMI 355080]|nr:hypothetical protein N0V82_005629 [Gnomoniopsis sp. IMI 355080]
MLDANDPQFFNVTGMQIFDGLYSNDPIAQDMPAARFVNTWSDVLGFNDSFTTSLTNASKACGYDDYLDQQLVFPPAGRQTSTLPGVQADQATFQEGCDLWNDVFNAANEVNPCFSIYTISQLCPMKYDPLGFSDDTNYVPQGSGPVYFDRQDVKNVIHAPNKTWSFCTNGNPDVFVNGTDTSVVDGPGSQPVLPNVIDRTQNVILGHGSQDFVLISDGTLLSIQNMTFGGMMGFQSRPADPLYIPYHANDDFTTFAGAGVMGTAHKERGLTYIAVSPAGHFLTKDTPAVAFRSMEVLLGRVEGFQSMVPFTIDTNNTAQPSGQMGNGTVRIVNGGVVGTASVSQARRASGNETPLLMLVVMLCLFTFW